MQLSLLFCLTACILMWHANSSIGTRSEDHAYVIELLSSESLNDRKDESPEELHDNYFKVNNTTYRLEDNSEPAFDDLKEANTFSIIQPVLKPKEKDNPAVSKADKNLTHIKDSAQIISHVIPLEILEQALEKKNKSSTHVPPIVNASIPLPATESFIPTKMISPVIPLTILEQALEKKNTSSIHVPTPVNGSTPLPATESFIPTKMISSAIPLTILEQALEKKNTSSIHVPTPVNGSSPLPAPESFIPTKTISPVIPLIIPEQALKKKKPSSVQVPTPVNSSTPLSAPKSFIPTKTISPVIPLTIPEQALEKKKPSTVQVPTPVNASTPLPAPESIIPTKIISTVIPPTILAQPLEKKKPSSIQVPTSNIASIPIPAPESFIPTSPPSVLTPNIATSSLAVPGTPVVPAPLPLQPAFNTPVMTPKPPPVPTQFVVPTLRPISVPFPFPRPFFLTPPPTIIKPVTVPKPDVTIPPTIAPLLQSDSKFSSDSLITLIRKRKFPFVEQYLTGQSPVFIEKTIKDVYQSMGSSFNVLIDLAKSMTSITPSFYTVNTLFTEMQTHEPLDAYQLITLANVLQAEVLQQNNCNTDIRTAGKALLDQMLELIKTTVSDFLSKAMNNEKYPRNAVKEELCDKILLFQPDINDDVMNMVVDNTYDFLPTSTILKNFNSHKHLSQRLSGVMAVFWKLYKAKKLNDNTMVDIASQLYFNERHEDYKFIADEKKELVDKVKQRLPECVKNAYFADTVCIRNKGTEEYLFAANHTYNYDDHRRSIFTYCPGIPVKGSYWKTEKIGRNVVFKNRDVRMEYLYAAEVEYNAELRNIFTWIPGGNAGTKVAWRIEILGDYCSLKNIHFEEYLFSSLMVNPDDMRYIFTWKQKNGTILTTQFEWQIISC